MSNTTNKTQSIIKPDIPLPQGVNLRFTTRLGGFSGGCYKGFNLANHVGDSLDSVSRNRDHLNQSLQISSSWLEQVHGTEIVCRSSKNFETLKADGVFTLDRKVPCAILTADCLPILMWDDSATQVAAIHAGWRGLAAGILFEAIALFNEKQSINVFLGPAISQKFFEVGVDVVDAFKTAEKSRSFCGRVSEAFEPAAAANKYMANLYRLAEIELRSQGVSKIFGGNFCTYAEEERFYSYRRDGQCGRMASIIWLS